MIWTLGFILSLYLFIMLIAFLVQERIIFFPEKLPSSYKYVFPFQFKEYFLDEDSGGSINVLHFKTKQNKKGLVLYFHGNAGNMALWGLRAENFITKGYDVLMFDYKGFGKSRGKRTEKNMFQTAEHMYEFAKKFETEEKIILYGVSLGSGFATYLASKYPCKKLILETPYFSILSMAQRSVPILPMRLLLKYPVRTDLFIKKVTSPIVLIHGKKDELIPYKDSLRLLELRKDAKLITVEEGTHNDLDLFDEYHKQLKKVL